MTSTAPRDAKPDDAEPLSPRLLHITHAGQDEAWVRGTVIPALGLSEGQYWTRAEDNLGAVRLEELERAVKACRYTLLVASHAAKFDEWTTFAGVLAQHAGIEDGKPRLLVVTRDFDPESDEALDLLPLRQRCLVCLDGSDPDRLAAALSRLAAQLALATTEEPVVECPYPGLRMFGTGDPASCFDRPELFFGRDAEGREIVERLRTRGRVLLVGPSGCGKSSLVRARVLPAFIASGGASLIASVRPAADPDAALRAALQALDPRLDSAIESYLANEEGDAAIPSLAERGGDAPPRILYIDPFEEVFLGEHGAAPDRRAAFFARLAVLGQVPGMSILLSMRADFYGDLMRSPIWEAFKEHRVELAPLRGVGLRDAIILPARRAGVYVEDDLVERLVRESDFDRASEALPLLQVTLEQLWAHRQWRYLSLASYARIAEGERRGLDAVLARHADASVAALAEPQQWIARRVLIDLVHLGEGRPDTRRRRSAKELYRSGDDRTVVDRVLEHLAARRLISAGAEVSVAAQVVEMSSPAGDGFLAHRHIDLAHDTLITGWPSLSKWIGERRVDLRSQRRLEARAAGGGLLAASELPEFIRWIVWIDTPAGQALGASESLRRLVRRSVAARRRLRVALALALAVAVTFAIFFRLQNLDLRRERTKTKQSISKAAETAELVVFELDTQLQTVAGAASLREALLKRSRRLLEELRMLGGLGLHERTSAASKAAEADLALEHGRVVDARALYLEVLEDARRRVDSDPTDANWQMDLAVAYDGQGRMAAADGQLDVARAWFDQACEVGEQLTAAMPDNGEWQHALSVSYDHRGEIEETAGQLERARTWFERSLEIRKRFAAQDPESLYWRRDLSVSFNKLGDVAFSLEQLDVARRWFEQFLEASDFLAVHQPTNSEWQRDRSLACDRLGNVAMAEGALDVARDWFKQSLATSEELLAKEPNNTVWGQDLIASYNKLGEVSARDEQLDVARSWFERALAAGRLLAKLDEDNPDYRRNLSISYSKLGEVALAAGNLGSARTWFEQALESSANLAAREPGNVDWQRDLAVSHSKLGELELKEGHLAAARERLEKTLAINEALAAVHPGSAGWKRDLSGTYDRLGDIAMQANQHELARRRFAQSLTIRETLAAQRPGDMDWQRDLSISYNKLGDVALASDQLEEAHGFLEKALEICTRLLAQQPNNAGGQRDLSLVYELLGDVEMAMDKLEMAGESFQHSLVLRQRLAEASEDARLQYDLLVTHMKLVQAFERSPQPAAKHLQLAATIYASLRRDASFQGDAQLEVIGKMIERLRR